MGCVCRRSTSDCTIELFRSTISKSRMGNHGHVQEKESHGTSDMIIIQSKDHNYEGTCRSRVRWGAKERWGGRGESEGTRHSTSVAVRDKQTDKRTSVCHGDDVPALERPPGGCSPRLKLDLRSCASVNPAKNLGMMTAWPPQSTVRTQ